MATSEMRVLVVEDHADTREIYAWCLEAAGWRVDTVTNGAEAISFAAAFRPDVIVMDLHMPLLDGIRATQFLKADPRTAHIPVVGCSAFWQLHRDELESAGFDDFVPKPCEPETLRDAITRLMAPAPSTPGTPGTLGTLGTRGE
jgi:CheY-like chemotaxis protein